MLICTIDRWRPNGIVIVVERRQSGYIRKYSQCGKYHEECVGLSVEDANDFES